MTAFPQKELDILTSDVATNAAANAVNTELAPQHKRITVTTSEILACNTTPVELLAAPGAGFAHVIERAVIRNEFLTAAYDFSTVANISYTDESGAPIIALAALFIEAAATVIASRPGELTGDGGASTGVQVNAPVVFGAPDADPTTGEGSFVIDLWYRTVATS